MERQQQAVGSPSLNIMEKGSSMATHDSEAHIENPIKQKQPGGWKTFPFIAGTLTGLILGGEGWKMNLIVFLIRNFNTKNIYAAQVYNIVNGCTNFLPVIGAIATDSFLGSYLVIFISSVISLLGTVLILATAVVKSLKPQPCQIGSELCEQPKKYQFAVLYSGIALATIGLAGTRFTLGTMGANQLHTPKEQGIFFNWYFFTFYTAVVVSTTAFIYIEDNVSWGLGLGLCVAANSIGLIIFWLGNRFYVHDKPQGSPYTSLAQVVAAAIRKRKIPLSSRKEDYLYQHDKTGDLSPMIMEKNFRFLNRAALIMESDMRPDGSVAKPWSLCNLQQVKDLKSLIRILPLWSTGVLLSTPIAVQNSLTVLQALLMDRHLGPHFKIPAGSIIVLVMLSASVCLTLIERVLNPLWRKLFHQHPTHLQRIGIGHVINVMGMAVSAIVETRRLRIVRSHHLQTQPSSMVVPMSALWLFPQLILVGIGEAFHFPGQVALYYQEFPLPLKSTATAMIGMVIGVAYYLSTAVVDVVQRCTGWLPDDLNQGRLDNMYWVLVVFGVANFVYYLVCSWFYKYQNAERVGSSASGT